jgi:formamidopyrimidine-DNA glycosylase
VPELPEVEVVRRGLAAHVVGRRIARVDVAHPRAVRRHIAGGDDFPGRLAEHTITAACRRGKYLWLELDGGAPGSDAVLAHLGMSGQMLLAEADRPDEKHLRIRIAFADQGPELRFVDQRTFGGLSVHPLVPAEAKGAGASQRASASEERTAPGSRPSNAEAKGVGASQRASASEERTAPGSRPSNAEAKGAGASQRASASEERTAPGSRPSDGAGGGLLPEPIAHIARDPMDPAFSLDDVVAGIRRRRTELKRALLDQTTVSGIGNIYADEALWRARLHGARPTERLTRVQGRAVLIAAAEVMDEALAQGGTSFDALYVNVNGASGYFDRSLAAYGQADRPCPRCGTPIRREPFMNRSSYFCPRCQPRPRRPRMSGKPPSGRHAS